MNATRRAQVEQLADSVRRACGAATPVDVEGAVTKLGGTLRRIPSADFEARIEKVATGFEIMLNTVGPETRQRFSVAHELGHLFLHMGYLVDEAKWAKEQQYTDSVYYRFGYNTEEYEANEFAAAFLMPASQFAHVADQHRSGNGFVLEPIARYFNVSKEAAAIRGRWLGLFAWE